MIELDVDQKHSCACQDKEKVSISNLKITLEFCETHETIAFVSTWNKQ